MNLGIKIISCISAVCMALGSFGLATPVGAAEAAAEKMILATDEYKLFTGLGCIDADAFELYEDTDITRGQFVSILAAIMGFNKTDIQTDISFSDVEKTDSCYGAIAYLTSIGIDLQTNGYMFLPDKSINFNDAAMMVIEALGYGDLFALKYKNDKSKALLMLAELDADKGVSLKTNGALTADNALKLLKNAAFTEMLYPETVGENVAYTKNRSDKTLIGAYRGICKKSGIVTDNGITALNGKTSIKGKNIKIGDDVLSRKDFGEAYKLLGHHVDYYFINADEALLYASVDSLKEKTVTIDATSLQTDDPRYSLTNIVYRENGRTKTERVKTDADFIYNGEACNALTKDDISFLSGRIKLIDSDTDGSFEYVFIEEYEDFTITAISDNRIYINGGIISLDEYNEFFIFNADGSPADSGSINGKSVISVYKSKQKTVIEIVVSGSKITGTVEQLEHGSENGRDIYTVGGNGYTLSEAYEKNQKAGLQDAPAIVIGKCYDFGLNAYGEIVYAAESMTDKWRIAYCVGIGKEKERSIGGNVAASLIMPDNTYFKAFFAKKVKLNGGKAEDAKKLLESNCFFDGGNPIRQPVRIKLNGMGDICAVETPSNALGSEYGIDGECFSLDAYVPKNTFRRSQRTIDNYIFAADSIIFEDNHLNDGKHFETEDVTAATVSQMEAESVLYDVYLYDVDPSMTASVAVYSRRENIALTNVMTVTKVTNVLGDDGEYRKQLSGYIAGALRSYIEYKDGIIADDIKKGDVCKLTLEGTKLSDVTRIVSMSSDPNPFTSGTVIDAKWADVFGYLYAAAPNSVSVLAPPTYTYTKVIGNAMDTGNLRITVYDLNKKEVLPGTVADLQTNVIPDNNGNFTPDEHSTKIYIHRVYDIARDIVILKR